MELDPVDGHGFAQLGGRIVAAGGECGGRVPEERADREGRDSE
jgi:hypothetical protein